MFECPAALDLFIKLMLEINYMYVSIDFVLSM